MAKASPVTRNDVAEYAGVSSAVVSYVVNDGPRRVAPETRERVLEAIRVLGYRPNATARALRMGTTQTFGLIVPDSGNPLYAELARAIEKEASARGYVVLQTNAGGDPTVERTKIAELVARRVSAIILATPTEEPELSETDVPVIALNRPVTGATSLIPEYREGARIGVEHLIGHGHERVGLVMGLDLTGWRPERELGWRDALEQAGLPEGPIARGTFTRQGGYEAGRRLLKADRPPAVFVSSDLQAVGVLRALHEARLDVPGDVAVLSFDGTAESEFSWPPLSVIRQPIERIAKDTVARLVDGQTGIEQVTYPTELILRRSCGCGEG
ncbi:LacI family transcriptional regulator [Kribbella amoyensis]|uniref:LacI family transcriptional regulator n=1 Tax=Kribbella amoyensis TaxID=996641 RepID=A0A561BM99_9ACTN|nr:LacI family DNA-binding transcriptional regulator [Kribbella amoyensis]TWD79985.1 LacI family transcriptional regulator [Kribbella amoyensis]